MLLFRDSSQRLLFIVGTKRASFLVDDALCASSRVNERVKTYAEPAHCPQLLPCIAAIQVPIQLDEEIELSHPELPRQDDVTSQEAACDAANAAAPSTGI